MSGPKVNGCLVKLDIYPFGLYHDCMARKAKARKKPGGVSEPTALASSIRDRIVELVRIRAGDLLVNPKNPKEHGEDQRRLLRSLLGEIGYADALLAFKTSDGLMLFDGHLRRDLDPDQVVPVLVTDLSPKEAGKMLALFDPSGDLAQIDAQAQSELLAEIESIDNDQAALLDQMLVDSKLAIDIDSQLSSDADSNTIFRNLDDRTKSVKIVIYLQDIDIVESALLTTGLTNRGDAMTAICRYFLEKNVYTEG